VQRFVEAVHWMAIDHSCEHVGAISEAVIPDCSVPPSEPANRWFLHRRAMRGNARSTTLSRSRCGHHRESRRAHPSARVHIGLL
jgi:hypothetical protein